MLRFTQFCNFLAAVDVTQTFEAEDFLNIFLRF